MTQKDIFLKSEGDAWFNRNNKTDKLSPDMKVIQNYIAAGLNVLEIGCADGNRLNSLAENANFYGLDPSKEAIENGTKKYSDISLSVGTSDILEFEDAFFDVVIFGFCLYLVDRNLLFKSIAEADRVLKDKGFLIITDFDPQLNLKNQYKHFEGVYSYKCDYPKLFLSNPAYSLVEKKSFSHYGDAFHVDENERVATTVLYKDIENAYVTK